MSRDDANDSASPDDWSILRQVASGETEVFATLVERHQDRVVRHCQRLLGDREAALDAAQEVFLKTFRKAGSLEPRGHLYTWLYRVATNHCLNRIRRRRLVRLLSFGDEREGARSPLLDPGPGPDRALDDKERWEATARAIQQLPGNQRSVLVLAKFEGLSYREIARILKISEGAVESRLWRAMRRLEKVLEGVKNEHGQ